MKKFLFILPLAAMLFAACEKENGAASLTLETEALEFSAEGGSQNVMLYAKSQWNISTNGAEWLEVTPTSGNGDTQLTVSVAKYTDAVIRTAEVTIEGSGAKAVLSILQHRPEAPDQPEERSYKVRAYEQEFSVPAPQGFTYKATVEGEGVEIVATDDEAIVLHFSANTTTESRESTLKLTTADGAALETVHLTQSWRSIEPGELLISEVFFAGMKIEDSESSDSSDGDQYFRLTNNTDDTLYADGVLIAISTADSQTSSVGAYWAYPELPDKIGVSTLYQIPGEGTDVPVKAGESLILAINAQNFKAENGSGCDLSKADFEFYDYTGNDDFPDIDNPDVKNLLNWFKSSWTYTSLHDRGYESYAIAITPNNMTSNLFMKEHPWNGQRVMDFNGYHFEDDITDAYLIPCDWVLDAVNCAVAEDLGTLAFNAKMDAGYTNVSTVDRDPERFGKAISRKKDEGGKLVDTNNSTNDFEVAAPSMK